MAEKGLQPSQATDSYWMSDEFLTWALLLAFPTNVEVSLSTFKSAMLGASIALRHCFAGYITLSNKRVTSFTHIAYPRKKYSASKPFRVTSQPQGMRIMTSLVEYLDAQHRLGSGDPKLIPMTPSTYRTIIGLRSSQHAPARSPEHSVADVQSLMIRMGMHGSIAPIELFVAGLNSVYNKAAVLVEGPINEAPLACSIGVQLGQERFTLERAYFEHSTVQMVETTFCQDPEFLPQ